MTAAPNPCTPHTQELLRLGFVPFLWPFSLFPLPWPGEDSTSAFLVAYLLLIPGNLSRIKTPLRKNGPGSNTCYANGSKSLGPLWRGNGDRGLPVVLEHPPPLTTRPRARGGYPELPPTRAQAQFHPTLMVLQFFQVIFIEVKRN